MRRLPPLNTLPYFEATVRLGSVKAAAKELGRTHGAVSKQLKMLADDLGGDLFEKAGTGVRPTERGRHFGKTVSSVLNELDTHARLLRSEVNDNHLEVTVSATFATRWLMAHLPKFYAHCPGLQVDLRMSGAAASDPDGFGHVLLSYDRLRGSIRRPDVIALGDTSYGLVCQAGYDVALHGNDVHFGTRLSQPGAEGIWQRWEELSGRTLHTETEIEYAHHILAIEAANAGLGVALAERRLVASDLASRRLVAPCGFVTVPGGFHAAVANGRPPNKAVLKFLAWLKEELRQDHIEAAF